MHQAAPFVSLVSLLFFDVSYNLLPGSFTDRGHEVAWAPHMPAPQLSLQLRVIEEQPSWLFSPEHLYCVRKLELRLTVQKPGLASDISYTIRYGTGENTHLIPSSTGQNIRCKIPARTKNNAPHPSFQSSRKRTRNPESSFLIFLCERAQYADTDLPLPILFPAGSHGLRSHH